MRGPKLFVVTDPAYADDPMAFAIEAVAAVFPPGVLGVQLRDKLRPKDEVRALAERLRAITRAAGAWLVVNGDAELAREIGAEGVHLGGGAMSVAEARRICGANVWVSIAAHSDDAVRAAAAERADAALVSPIFPTAAGAPSGLHSEIRLRVRDGKPSVLPKAPRGVEAIASARALAGENLAIYALGGVTRQNARECVEAGADGVAVIRALLASPSPDADARALFDAISSVK